MLGGVPEGDGVFTRKDGSVYTGQFLRKGPGKNGKHGYGKIVFTDGRSFEGRWIDDLPSDGILTGRTGQRISLDYGWYRGKFREGRVYKIKISFDSHLIWKNLLMLEKFIKVCIQFWNLKHSLMILR